LRVFRADLALSASSRRRRRPRVAEGAGQSVAHRIDRSGGGVRRQRFRSGDALAITERADDDGCYNNYDRRNHGGPNHDGGCASAGL
jgi:hypothetical protein